MGLFKSLFKHRDNQNLAGLSNQSEQPPIIQSERKPVQAESVQQDQAIKPVVQETEPGIIKKPDRIEKAKAVRKHPYVFPSIDLLNSSSDSATDSDDEEVKNNADKLNETLSLFGVKASIVNIVRGPSVTRYELRPAPGVRISKITGLETEIALSLAAEGLRIVAPIPGKSAIGIDVPKKVTSIVTFKDLIESEEFQNCKSKLNCVLGKSISGEVVCTDLSEMPHLLIAGTTGSGKSVCINSLLMSILFKAKPDEVKLLLIDPKSVEFSKYRGIPHLLVPVVTDVKKAAAALNWAVSQMLNRYRIFSEYDCRDIKTYNQLIDKNLKYIEEQKQLQTYDPYKEEHPCQEINGLKVPTEHMCYIVIAIDELSELMLSATKEVEGSITRIAQMARAAGIHMVVATQHPTSDIITASIKANIPSRIALKVGSHFNSQTILGVSGAEKLSGHGDMLYSPVGEFNPIRVQGCFVKDDEIERVTEFIRKSNQAEYNAEIEEKIRRNFGKDQSSDPLCITSKSESADSMMEEAIRFVVETGQASTSLLQRRLKVGYARAGRMIDEMEQMGIVGPHKGDKPRDVLITYKEWINNPTYR